MTTETRRRPAPTDGMGLAEHAICAMTGVLSLVDGASPA